MLNLYTIIDQENFYAGNIWIKNGFIHYTRYKTFFIGSYDKTLIERWKNELQQKAKKLCDNYIFNVVLQNISPPNNKNKIGDCQVIKYKLE